MTDEMTDEVRRLAVEALEGLGVAVSVNDEGDLVGSNGAVYALRNLVHRAARAEPEKRRHVVFEHVATLVDAGRVNSDDLGEDEFRTRLRARVFGTAYAADVPGYEYMRPVDDGPHPALKCGLCLDWPDHVQVVRGDELDGREVDQLWRIAITATCAEPIRTRTLARPGTDITLFTGDSWFGSSRILDLPALAEQTGEPGPNGLIVAIPTAEELMVHRPRTQAITTASIRAMLTLTAQATDAAEGWVSRNLFYWDGTDAPLTAMTRPDRGGTAPAFRKLLARLP